MENNSSGSFRGHQTQQASLHSPFQYQQPFRHPMLFPEIIAKVCIFLPAEDLKACRLVNRLWNRESTAVIRLKIRHIYLCNKKQAKKFIKIFDNDSADFPLPNPFTRFILHQPSVSEFFKALYIASLYQKRWEIEFLHEFGKNITELHYSEFSVHRQLSFYNLHQLIVKFCPSLTSLVLQVKDLAESSPNCTEVCGHKNLKRKEFKNLRRFAFIDTNEISAELLTEFLTFMPNLHTLGYRYSRNQNSEGHAPRKLNFVSVYSNLYRVGKLRKVVNLDFDTKHSKLRHADIKKLLDLEDLQLEVLGAKVNVSCKEEYYDLCMLMEKLEPTLRTVDIRVRFSTNVEYEFRGGWPLMPKVVELTMLYNTFIDCFIQSFPNAKKVVMVQDPHPSFMIPGPEEMDWEDEAQGVGAHDNENHPDEPSQQHDARKLIVLSAPSFQHVFRDLALTFSHVKELEMEVHQDGDLRDVWAEMKNLKVLKITIQYKISDAEFIGDGLADKELPTYIDSKSHMDLHTEELLNKLKSSPYLGNLRELQTLEINSENCTDFKFTWALIVYGICFLDNLRSLSLPPNISPKCLENSIPYLTRLVKLRRLCVCESTFHNLLPFHNLKWENTNLDILVKYRTKYAKQLQGVYWKHERLQFPDFLPLMKPLKNKAKSKHNSNAPFKMTGPTNLILQKAHPTGVSAISNKNARPIIHIHRCC